MLALYFRRSFRPVNTAPGERTAKISAIPTIWLRETLKGLGLARWTRGYNNHVSACQGLGEAVIDSFIAFDNLVVPFLVYSI